MIREEDLSPDEVFYLIEAGEKLIIRRDGRWKSLRVKQENPDKKNSRHYLRVQVTLYLYMI